MTGPCAFSARAARRGRSCTDFLKRESTKSACSTARGHALRQFARQFGPRVKVYGWEQRESASRGASVLVNTTPVGMKGRGSPDLGIGFSGFDPRCVVCDIVYVPLETEMLAAARARGLRTVDGLGMLLHQAVPGFEKWFGVRPEVTQELRALVVADITGTA